VLRGRLARRTGAIPPELLASHLLSLDPAWDWPVLEAAADALLRRLTAARRQRLRVSERPRGTAFGRYVVRPKGMPARPYRTVLRGAFPVRGSCDCADYARGSLGLCKHLLVALDDLFDHPRRLAWARASGDGRPGRGAWLGWDPVCPLDGPGDWLARVRLEVAGRRPRVERWFHGGRPRSTFPDAPARRAELVEALQAWLRSKPSNAAWEPALAHLVDEELAELALRQAPAAVESGPMAALYPYQREAVAHFLDRGRLLLGDDMGLGKTVQAIAAGDALFAAGRVRRGLLLVPNSLKHQWLDEWTRFSGAPVAVVEGPPSDRAALYERMDEGFLIVNYELVLRDIEHLRRWAPQLCVLDEAQRIKNWQTRTARTIKTLRPPYRLALTGTPLENRLDELVSVFEWVDDRALEPKWRLAPYHVIPDDEGGRALGVTHLDTLRERLAPHFLRRRRAEILDELPPRVDQRVPVELTRQQAALHEELDRPIAQLLKIARRRPLRPYEHLRLMSLFTRQRVIANGLAQHEFEGRWPALRDRAPSEERLRLLHSPKLQVLRELLERLAVDDGRNVIVFSQWVRMLQLAGWACSDVLERAGLKAAFFTGKQGLRARTRSVVELHDDPQTRVLFCSDAGSVGLNLQRAADCVIHLDLPWNPAVFEQRVARIHRLGQDRSVDVIHLVTEGSIEARIEQALRSKQALFDGLFDGELDTVDFGRTDTIAAFAPTEEAPGVPAREPAPPSPAEPPSLSVVRDATPRPAPEAALGALLSSVSITRRADGGVTLDADPEAAAVLEGLFGQLATMMRAAAEAGTRAA